MCKIPARLKRRNPSCCPAWWPAIPPSAALAERGNDLHYRGYDILDVADTCEFEEIAYLLIHEKLPDSGGAGWRIRKNLEACGICPPALKQCWRRFPSTAHPMDVMRTGVSALGTVLPEAENHSVEGARDLADRLLACLGRMLLYWYHYSHNNRRIDRGNR